MLEERQNLYFDTEEFYEIIAYYLDVGDLEYARKAIDYALEIYPANSDLEIKKLEYFLAMGRLKEADVLIKGLKDVGKHDVDYLICAARFWSLKENHEMALRFYKDALQFDEDREYIYNCIGNEYLILNRLEDALKYYKKALLLDPHDDFSFFSVIQCYEELHQRQECIAFLKSYIDNSPYSEMAWVELGQQNMLIKNYEEAHRAFDFACVINPDSLNAYTQKAASLEMLEDYEAAIEVYREILENDENPAFTFLSIGKCFLKLGKPYKALKAFHQAVNEDPEFEHAWVAASDIYDRLGNYDEALYYLNRALSLDNSNIDFWKRRAYLHIQLVKFEESVLDYQRLVKLEPNNFYNWLGLCETLMTIGDYKKAIEAAHRGLKHFNRAELYYQLSNCYYQIGREEEGNLAFKKAAGMNGGLQSEMFKKYPILENRQSPLRQRKIKKP